MAQCFAVCETTLTSSTIPTTAVRPFCNSNGFSVTAAVEYDYDCGDTDADVFVIVETNLKAGNSRFNGIVSDSILRFYSNLQYAPAGGSPTLTSIETGREYQKVAIVFRFRMPLPPSSPAFTDTLIVTLPFEFAPNFFFGDTPWNVWVSAREPDAAGLPIFPPMPPFNNFLGKLVGTLSFDEPYFPIVGSQNVSTHFADMTGLWADPNVNRTHSLMLLPDASGNPPVLTVDVPLFTLGFFNIFADRGTLLMSPGAQIKVLNGDTMAIGRVDMFTCVDQVSKGIVVEQGGRLDQESSTFSDAELAIHLKKGSYFNSYLDLSFFNNYRGMRIDNNGSSAAPNIEAMFVGLTTTFETNVEQLKLPYLGMAAPTCSRGYGMEILSHPGVFLRNCDFLGLNNGIRLFRSSLTLRTSKFEGIMSDAGSTPAHHGHAIWGLGFGAQTFNFDGGGNRLIETCDHGLHLRNMNAIIHRTGIQATTGISLIWTAPTWGIRGLGVHQAEFRDNNIEILSGSLPSVIGVDVLNTSKMLAYCNDVNTAATGFDPKGYLFKNVNQSDYICNTADKMSTGMEFSVLCEGTTLKGSEFDNSPIGLRLKNDVTLGTQGLDQMNQAVEDHGNRWGSSVATHEATMFGVVSFSRFGVDPVENVAFKPNTNWPNWFVDEVSPTSTFSCAGFNCLTGAPESSYKDRSVEMAVANGSIHNVGLPGAMPKMLENHLYSELQKNPAWAANNPIYAQFLQSKYSTTTDAFWQIQEGIDALNNRTNSEQTAIAALEADIQNHRNDLYLMDSTFASGTAINRVHYTQKLATLSTAVTSLQAQLDAVRNTRLTQAAQLLTQNAAIAAAQTWEQSTKQANELEINLFIQDSVSSAQLALLDTLGTLCPNTNGDAVFRAQVLYNRFVEKEFFPVCNGARGGAGERSEKDAQAVSSFSVYPNPTTGIATIAGLDATGYRVDILDISGHKVAYLTLTDNSLDLTGFSSGIYFVRLMHPECAQISTSKIVVFK